MKKLKAMSMQTMVVAGVLGAILTAVAISRLWDATEKQKISSIASSIVSQNEALSVQRMDNYEKLADFHDVYGDGDADYMDELIAMHKISRPGNFFEGKNYVWEIRRAVVDNQELFYIYFDSDKEIDRDLFKKAMQTAGLEDYIVE